MDGAKSGVCLKGGIYRPATKWKFVSVLCLVGLVLIGLSIYSFFETPAYAPRIFGVSRELVLGPFFAALGILHVIPAVAFAIFDSKFWALVAAITNTLVAILDLYVLGVGLSSLVFQVLIPVLTWKWFHEMFGISRNLAFEHYDVVRRLTLLFGSAFVFALVGPLAGGGVLAPDLAAWFYTFGYAPASAAGIAFGIFLASLSLKYTLRLFDSLGVRMIVFGGVGGLAGLFGCGVTYTPAGWLGPDQVGFWLQAYWETAGTVLPAGITSGIICGMLMIWPTKKVAFWQYRSGKS